MLSPPWELMSLHKTDFAGGSCEPGPELLQVPKSCLRSAPFGFPLKNPASRAWAWPCPQPGSKCSVMIYQEPVEGWAPLSQPGCCCCGVWMTAAIRAALGAGRVWILSFLRKWSPSMNSYPYHAVTSFQTEVGSFPWLPPHFIFFPFCDWADFALLSWVSGLANCIFSFSYCRGTIE